MNQVITKAVILAAGMGLRLQEIGEHMPKGFIRLGETPIIEHSLRALIANGIQEILIVTGHKAEYYENLKKTYPEVITVKNDKYTKTGTMFSLGCAREFVDRDFILLESDLIYDPEAIAGMIRSPHKDCLLLSGKTNAGDEVYVDAAENRVTGISKERDNIKNLVGEYVGIAKISQQMYGKLVEFAGSNQTLSYDMGCMVEVADEHQISFLMIEDLQWAEIDDLSQMNRSQKVWKRIKAKRL